MSQAEKINQTAENVIKAIKNKDIKSFKSLIGPDLLTIGKDDCMLSDEFLDFVALFKHRRKDEQLVVRVTNLYSDLGQLLVDISLRSRMGIATEDSIHHMYIFLGPPNIYPLNKITGYEITQGANIPVRFHEKTNK